MQCWRVTADRGFLMAENPRADAAVEATSEGAALAEIMAAAADLPALIASGAIRRVAPALPIPDIAAAGLSERAAERLHQAYGFLANGYLWTPAAAPPRALPAALAVPFKAVSDRLGRPPVLSYAGSQLCNWRLDDAAAGIAPETLRPIQTFQDDADESWFWVIHIAIEAAGGPAVIAGARATAAARAGDEAALEAELGEIAAGLAAIRRLAERIEEGCSPESFFRTLRPFLFSPPEGVVFEGVAEWGERPKAFLGQTGAQSSLLPALCGALGVSHGRTELTDYLDAVRAYMPEPHRAFIAGLDGVAVRAAAGRSAALREAYNACIEAAAAFRRFHLTLAATYIAAKIEDPKGTGGTDFMRWLKHMTRETEAQRL